MKKIIDNKGRLFGKISIIDIFVILIVVILAIGLYFKFNTLDVTGASTPTETFTYEIRIKEVRSFAADSLAVGDKVYDKEGNRCIGQITAIDITDSTRNTTLANGTFGNVSVEDRYDIALTVEATGTISNDHYFIDKTFELNAGSSTSLYTRYYTFTGTVDNVEVGN